MSTFTLFPYLPPELRHQIWTLSLPAPQKITPFATFSLARSNPRRMKSHRQPNPTTLHVNHESRSITLEHYCTWHHTDSLGWQYIDFSIDTVCFNITFFSDGKQLTVFARMHSESLSTLDLGRVRRLEVQLRGLDVPERKIGTWIEKWMGGLFAGVRELNFLLLLGSVDRDAYRDGDEWIRCIVKKVWEKGNESLKLSKEKEGGELVSTVLSVEVFYP